MTWSDIAPATSRATILAPVQISCGKATGKTASMQDRLTITFRPDLMGGEGAWITSGARIRVMLGSDEHAGMIRIQVDPRGASKLHVAGGRSGSAKVRPMLVLRGLPWIPHERHTPKAVDHVMGDGWIQITLPAWARRAAPEPPAAAQAVREPVEADPAAPVPPSAAAQPPARAPHAAAPVPPAHAPRRNGRSFVDHVPDPVALGRRGSAPVRA